MLKLTRKNIKKLYSLVENIESFIVKHVKVGDTEIDIFGYIYQWEGMFDKNPVLLEARGLTVDAETKEVLSRPFHKFFNLKSDPPDNLLMIQEKVDGSMIHPFLYKENGETKIKFKSKLSPFSEVAIDAEKFIYKTFSELFIKMNIELLQNGITPIYEFYSPDHRIVVDYEKPFLKLLALRENISGNYIEFFTAEDLKSIVGDYKFITEEFIPKRYPISTAIEDIQALNEAEGVVLVAEDGERYKVKTAWYLERHHAFNLTTKQIFYAVINQYIDDIRDLSKDERKLAEIKEVENIVFSTIKDIENKIQQLIENTKNLQSKDKVVHLKDILKSDPFSGLIFGAVMKGTVPDVLNIFIRAPEKYWKLIKKIIEKKEVKNDV